MDFKLFINSQMRLLWIWTMTLAFYFTHNFYPRTETSEFLYIGFLLTAVFFTAIVSFTTSISSIAEDKRFGVSEMILTTKLKPKEYVFTKCFEGVITGIITGYSYLVIFISLTTSLYKQYRSLDIWVNVILAAIAFSVFSVVLGIMFANSGFLLKILLVLLVAIIPFLILVFYIISNLDYLKSIEILQHLNLDLISKLSIFILTIYSIPWLFLSIKNLEISDFIM